MEQASPLGPRMVADPSDPLALAPGGGRSAASWGAIFAGAIVAIATTLILLALGSGLGFAAISPWPGHGASARAFSVNAAIWLIVTQWLSAGLGGYIAGRLRTKWVGTHTHEVFFRDTAHGLVTWSLATVIVATVLAGSVTSVMGGGLRALGGAASAGLQGMAGGHSAPGGLGAPPAAMPPMAMPGPLAVPGGPPAALAYDIDKLFRPSGPTAPGGGAGNPVAGSAPTPRGPGDTASGEGAAGGGAEGPVDTDGDPRVETVYITLHALAGPGFSDQDRAYLAELVQWQTGDSAQDAQQRVGEFVAATMSARAQARAAADGARKAAAETSIYTALAMLIGAFIACITAALGGRLRDEHP